MELVDLTELQDFQRSKVVKKIPIISDQLMSTIIFIGANSITPPHQHTNYDEIHYIIKGFGTIMIDGESQSIAEGMMILVPKSKPHSFTTADEQMMVLSINLVPEGKK